MTTSARTPGAARGGAHRYAELHAHSAYSFLDGANEPVELVTAALDLGLEALALTDHDGFPGIVKHAEAGRTQGLPTIHGAELTLDDGSHLPVLARNPRGYRRLCSAISQHNLAAGRRAAPAHRLAHLGLALAGDGHGPGSDCLVLTGTANGPVRKALGSPHDPDSWDLVAAGRRLGELVDIMGDENVAVELTLDGGPTDAALTQALRSLAEDHHLPLIATGAVRCARPTDARVADVLAATRLVTDLEGARGHLPALGRWLRSPQDMARLHRRAPSAVDRAAELAADLAFDLSLVVPDLPDPDVPPGHTPTTWLRALTEQGALSRYGSPSQDPRAWRVLAHELDVIEDLGFAGYFLIVRSIVDFCGDAGILCQGRGSAANSAVCYALGITAVDAVRHKMLFERFLSPGRSGYPDIDLDIEACRREEVIQHVYARYGRDYAAQVANVISYRPRSAIRDAARALGHPAGLQDRWASGVEHGWSRGRTRGAVQKWADEPAPPTSTRGDGESSAATAEASAPHSGASSEATAGAASSSDPDVVPRQVLDVADRLLLLPRHLGIHSGGMVLADRPVTEVCPVRWATMEGRTVLQWDKDDCAAAGLVKFDLLGLGMLTALRLAFTSLAERGETVPEDPADEGIGETPATGGTPATGEPSATGGTPATGETPATGGTPATGKTGSAPLGSGDAPAPGHGALRSVHRGRPWGLHTLPEEDPAVYRLLCAADTVGVFQVESRAQMATLPRLRPSTFYDIVVEVALIRPGPIQGNAVNPYIRRRLGREKVTYLHDSLRPALEKTLGIPLFQEQLMQIAIDAAGFSPAEADALRQAMGSKRSADRMEALHARLVDGMAQHGIDAPTSETVFDKLRAFADFGFPESHAFSFAYLVYASAWLKVRKPEDFYAGLLGAQPMGFWSPQSLVADARRHGVRVLAADVNHSGAEASVEQRPVTGSGPTAGPDWQPVTASPEALTFLDTHPGLAVRLGLARLRGLGKDVAEQIVSERVSNGPFDDVADLARRVHLSRSRLETLASSGALASLGVDRREALWAAGVLAGEYGRRHAVGVPDRAPGKGTTGKGTTGSARAWYQPPLPGTAVGARAPHLSAMTARERQATDLRLAGVSTEGYPTVFLRQQLADDGVLRIADLSRCADGTRVRAAGVVTHRQRPHTAAGTIFLNLEDETGLLNVICSKGMWSRYRSIGRRATALVVRGRVESADGVVALLAEHLEALPGISAAGSRDWT